MDSSGHRSNDRVSCTLPDFAMSASARPILSYDDISAQPPATPPPPRVWKNTHSGAHPQQHDDSDQSFSAGPPPNKKRKKGPNQRRYAPHGQGYPQQHWDDPGDITELMSYESAPVTAESGSSVNGEGNGKGKGGSRSWGGKRGNGSGDAQGQAGAQRKHANSRPPTQEEEWDDSELIRAWDAANAEYHALHGAEKSWKTESVPRSLLWENVLPPSKQDEQDDAVHDEDQGEGVPQSLDETDAAPLDFENHYLPTPASSTLVGPPRVPEGKVSKDEAFQQVINSWYWAGYWTGNFQADEHEEVEEEEADVNGDKEGETELDTATEEVV
ncbi:hypothetical protein BOTBODRAFT_169784 [Botryobasidium botryosum FD-172 SS1]|uniref:Survival Motor Neuron Gemin2-binding domain-containing protein n=1 Tax=Botryobasidium botryosum (strain FD-172 SS1) TaxID=930990 RepID=A0A067MYE0_BOTB1|nr:hypothetical protein BOTBODRAFT_169784 [Botryobasidium botryosum FD-172 SS1]